VASGVLTERYWTLFTLNARGRHLKTTMTFWTFTLGVIQLSIVASASYIALEVVLALFLREARVSLLTKLALVFSYLSWLSQTLVILTRVFAKRAIRRQELFEWSLSQMVWVVCESFRPLLRETD
jgi:hypothetical protein